MKLRWSIYKGAGILFYTAKQGKIQEILLAKRAISPDKGKWSIPGGAMDDRDKTDKRDKQSFLHCAIRETNEEFTQNAPFQEVISEYLEKDIPAEKYKHCTIYIPFIFHWKTFFVPLKDKPQNWPVLNSEFSKNGMV